MVLNKVPVNIKNRSPQVLNLHFHASVSIITSLAAHPLIFFSQPDVFLKNKAIIHLFFF